nr:Putative arsenical resistance operon repressor ArsD [Bacillaceae bacterium JMAK1]
MNGQNKVECECTPSPTTASGIDQRRITLHFLELDMTRDGARSCSACTSVEEQVRQVISDAEPILEQVNTVIEFEKTLVQSLEQAESLCFKASPTIRIAEMEILPTKGDIHGLGDRYWEWHENDYATPPSGLIMDAVLRAYVEDKEIPELKTDNFQVPNALIEYFSKKRPESLTDQESNDCGCS